MYQIVSGQTKQRNKNNKKKQLLLVQEPVQHMRFFPPTALSRLRRAPLLLIVALELATIDPNQMVLTTGEKFQNYNYLVGACFGLIVTYLLGQDKDNDAGDDEQAAHTAQHTNQHLPDRVGLLLGRAGRRRRNDDRRVHHGLIAAKHHHLVVLQLHALERCAGQLARLQP